MNLPIALAQFIMLALGVMASRILLNSGAISANSSAWADRLAVALATHGIWLLAIPALWLLLAQGCEKFRPRWSGAIQSLGVALAVAVLAGMVGILVF